MGSQRLLFGIIGTLALVVSLGATSCGPELEPISHVDGIRILAVKKSAPYARPGEVVNVRMLWEDGGAHAPRDAQPFFAFWCVNPPGDLFSECLSRPPELAPVFQFGTNDFNLTIPSDSLRPSALDPRLPPSGMAVVFYGVCSGQLSVAGIPVGSSPGLGAGGAGNLGGGSGRSVGGAFGGASSDSAAVTELLAELANSGAAGTAFLPQCLGEDGQPLGSDDFVLGYSTVFVYEQLRNAPPAITGFEIDGVRVEPDCLDEACRAPFDLPDLDGCRPGVACIDACPSDGAAACPPVNLRPLIDPSVAEQDGLAWLAYQQELSEAIWVSYFVDRGATSDVRLVNDATTGWRDDFSATFRAPSVPGPLRIWAAARDSRGGVSWIRVPAYVR